MTRKVAEYIQRRKADGAEFTLDINGFQVLDDTASNLDDDKDLFFLREWDHKDGGFNTKAVLFKADIPQIIEHLARIHREHLENRAR